MQAQFLRHFHRLMTPDEQRLVLKHDIRAYDKELVGITPGKYAIGHRLGVEYIGCLNELLNSGRDAGEELGRFYAMSNKEQLEHLLYGLRLKFATYGEQERNEVDKIFRELGARAYSREI